MEEKNIPQGVAGAPNEENLLKLMERTGYSMVQENGQRKYGPCPDWKGPAPPRGCEIFVGKIPRDCYEDELVPVFEKIGKIYELRLMMDFSGSNRGYAFVMYTNKHDAQKAVRELNNYEIRKGRLLGVCMSVDNCRLFVGGIPKNKGRDEILQEMNKVTEGVVDVIVYPSAVDKTKNRGFAFVEYESHRDAAMARRKLIPGRIQLWGHQIAVDWAEPEQDVDEDVMAKVKILYVRNLMLSTTEDTIRHYFSKACGNENAIERVKKLRDYAFVHFKEREDALKAMDFTNNNTLDGSRIEVVLAKPVDKNDYRNYARGKAALQQVNVNLTYVHLFFRLMVAIIYMEEIHLHSMDKGYQGRTAVGLRGALRGRGRGAAGSRGAGNVTRGGYVPGFMGRGYRRYDTEDRMYDLLPGMELTPTNPVTLKPQTVKSVTQMLEDLCQKNAWGSPVYQLHSTMNGENQLFLFKITIPAIGNTPFQPNKLCRTEVAMSQNPYQGRAIAPAYAVPNGVPRSDITYASTVPVVTSANSYVVTPGPGKMPPPPSQSKNSNISYICRACFLYQLNNYIYIFNNQKRNIFNSILIRDEKMNYYEVKALCFVIFTFQTISGEKHLTLVYCLKIDITVNVLVIHYIISSHNLHRSLSNQIWVFIAGISKESPVKIEYIKVMYIDCFSAICHKVGINSNFLVIIQCHCNFLVIPNISIIRLIVEHVIHINFFKYDMKVIYRHLNLAKPFVLNLSKT
ncbi:LOW QUALITY PROTEIN: hypothetical protein KUTeg_023718 [Tegillarca granosa]|uniref:RRM domain-containing protein n=1 Tax=Tegillarca granosa TaxID=220873 RepID=A0ABQ9E2J6_TEGGR|nr:LOW QUALITY PROTEIN: hypothetical protein KUTeg_023718 [Tegillarca granosa]